MIRCRTIIVFGVEGSFTSDCSLEETMSISNRVGRRSSTTGCCVREMVCVGLISDLGRVRVSTSKCSAQRVDSSSNLVRRGFAIGRYHCVQEVLILSNLGRRSFTIACCVQEVMVLSNLGRRSSTIACCVQEVLVSSGTNDCSIAAEACFCGCRRIWVIQGVGSS